MSVLAVEGVSKHFGGVAANEEISFSVDENEIVGIVGPNGAGKTTLFNQIAGFIRPDAGRIAFSGEDVTGKRPDEICRAGIGRTFQVVRVFADLTVLDNVLVGALLREKRVAAARDVARDVIQRVGLAGREQTLARQLPLAARRRVELARILATKPRLVLLDEVMAGLTQKESREAIDLVRSLRDELTVLMVEHVMEIVMPLSDRVVVLVEGRKLTEGSPEEVSRDERVIGAYLGEKFAARGR